VRGLADNGNLRVADRLIEGLVRELYIDKWINEQREWINEQGNGLMNRGMNG
jgi:hypothetical protein